MEWTKKRPEIEHSTIAAASNPNLEVAQKQLTIVMKNEAIPRIPKTTCTSDSDKAMAARMIAAII
jgi:hypothetical protein